MLEIRCLHLYYLVVTCQLRGTIRMQTTINTEELLYNLIYKVLSMLISKFSIVCRNILYKESRVNTNIHKISPKNDCLGQCLRAKFWYVYSVIGSIFNLILI